MAMDKERLLAYFQEQYLPRQEVLFKLPLNYSIDSFWPELLNRRKAKATLLPLYNASGMPYWYVLTKKMIAASERLCEEAISQERAFDPYRAEMTSAMTEEMFFTSFVEGAQIPLQEAMDFLARGTEPETIQEQMIWNNRHAWSEMVSGIYRPLDEPLVKALAWMLTEEMDGCAEDYRQVDNHPIAAMNNEPYDLPPAYSIPERMAQYCDFLRAPDTHPLIKATVAQAYLLVTRPFPEGNERLSRMMSSAVLLRCGYDFFRDISISSVIARENYRYYKAMCDILRAENGGDMTYFMEYYLELLARAVDLWKERQRRKEESALARERELAREPLKATAVSPPPPPDEPSVPKDANERDDVPASEEKDSLVVGEHLPTDQFLAEVDKLKHSQNPKTRQTPGIVREMLNDGQFNFTVQQWAERTGQNQKHADYQCRHLFQKGLLDRDKRGSIMTYTFRVIAVQKENTPLSEEKEEPCQPAGSYEPPPTYQRLLSWIAGYELSDRAYQRNAAAFFSNILEHGLTRFNSGDLIASTGISKAQGKSICDYLRRRKMLINITPMKKPAVYEFVPDNEVRVPAPERTPREVYEPEGSLEDIAVDQEAIEYTFESMLYSKSEIMRIAADTAIRLIREGQMTFLRADWAQLTGLPKDKAYDTCDVMVKRKIVRNIACGQKMATYRFNLVKPDAQQVITPDFVTRMDDIKAISPSNQIRRISQFLEQLIAKGQTRFSSDEWMQRFNLTKSGYGDDLRTAVSLGLIIQVGTTASRRLIYEINPAPVEGIRDTGLSTKQIEALSAIYDAFGDGEFTVNDCEGLSGHRRQSITYYLKHYVTRGIMTSVRQGSGKNIYRLNISPSSHPHCFHTGKTNAPFSAQRGSAPMAATASSRPAMVL